MEAEDLQVGEVVFVIALNCIIIFILYILQKNSIEKRIKHLKNEVQDLEDLVAAIIEEFEEIAEMTEAKISESRNLNTEIKPIEDLELESTSLAVPPLETDETIPEENQPEISPVTEDTPTAPVMELVTDEQNKSAKADNQRPVSDPRHQRILDLWREGNAVEEIAKQLGTGRGEVQLILGIYRRG